MAAMVLGTAPATDAAAADPREVTVQVGAGYGPIDGERDGDKVADSGPVFGAQVKYEVMEGVRVRAGARAASIKHKWTEVTPATFEVVTVQDEPSSYEQEHVVAGPGCVRGKCLPLAVIDEPSSYEREQTHEELVLVSPEKRTRRERKLEAIDFSLGAEYVLSRSACTEVYAGADAVLRKVGNEYGFGARPFVGAAHQLGEGFGLFVEAGFQTPVTAGEVEIDGHPAVLAGAQYSF